MEDRFLTISPFSIVDLCYLTCVMPKEYKFSRFYSITRFPLKKLVQVLLRTFLNLYCYGIMPLEMTKVYKFQMICLQGTEVIEWKPNGGQTFIM
jgi:hypothetical protein